MRRICCLIISLASLTAASAQTPALRTFAKVPQSFEANRGQAAKAIDFTSHGPGYSLSLSSATAYLRLFSASRADHSEKSSALSFRLVGADPKAHGDGLNRREGRSNYFLGSKSNQWLTDIPQYGRVEYHDVYPGIDIAYYGTNENLEYDFILGPHADPGRIRLAVEGADRLRIDDGGDLVLTVGSAEIRERKPLIYQKTESGQNIVRGRYVALEGNRIGFELERYDSSKALVIDPILVFSTYFGGSGADTANAIAVDGEGNSYIAGQTGSANLTGTDIGTPGFTGSYTAAYVAKISPAGALLSNTIIAGVNDAAEAGAVALDTNGNIYLSGYTSSSTFPTMNPIMAYQGAGDAFALELNNAGNTLIYSTYLGGSGLDYADGIAVDSNGNTLVGGSTTSGNFPAVNAAQSHRAGGYSPWVAKIAPGGSSLVYSTYWGGSATDYANGLTVDSLGDLILFGDESSMNFPVASAFQPNYCALASGTEVSTVHGWVAEFSPAGVPIYSTYICGTVSYYTIDGTTYPTYDVVRGGTVDTWGNAVITGTTASLSFPTMSPVQGNYGGGSASAFLIKLSPTGTLLYSTYLGGPATTNGWSVAVDPQNNMYVAGQTSASLPTVNPTQSLYGGGSTDAFLMKLNPAGSAILFSTYIGGNGADGATFLGVDGLGDAYVTGNTNSTNFPTSSPLQTNYGGGTDDAFLTSIQTKIKPTVSLTPPTSSITTAQSLSITITVNSGAGNPTATGTVTLNSGTYSSAATALSSGSATIVIPADTLAVGSDTLTGTYSGDTNDLTNTGTASATVTATSQAVLFAPAPGNVLPGNSATFRWTSAPGASGYDLWLGLGGPGSSSLYNTGVTTATSTTVTNLPTRGATIYARLYSIIGGKSRYYDYTYTEATIGTPATMVSPAAGSKLGSSNVKFTWTTGTGATQYNLWLGLGGPGSSSLYSSGWLATTTVTVPSVPAKGATVYARLYSDVNGVAKYNDYTYIEGLAGVPATVISPAQGSTLGNSNVKFTWTTGTGATQYNLWLGLTGPGSSGLYSSGWLTTTSATVPSMPAKGATVYGRLYSDVNGVTEYNDYTYTEK